MTDQDFKDIVEEDVKGEIPKYEREMLERPENLRRWHDELVDLKRGIEAQFNAKRAEAVAEQRDCYEMGKEGKAKWFSYRAEHEDWRRRANHFKARVERRITEVKAMIRRHHEQSSGNGSSLKHKQLLLFALQEIENDEKWLSPAMASTTRKAIMRKIRDLVPGGDSRRRKSHNRDYRRRA